MRTINSNKSPFKIGRQVAVIKTYLSGSVHLYRGDVGTITGIETYNLPDFGLFDVKVYSMDFYGRKISLGEGLMKEYIKPV